jgi:hypothetical protein
LNIEKEFIEFGEALMKLFLSLIYVLDGRAIMNLYFRDTSLIIIKVLAISGGQRRRRRRRW